MNIKYF